MAIDQTQIHLGSTDASPSEVGFDGARLDTLDRHYESLIRERKLQAAGYLLARRGQIFAHKTMGTLISFEESGDLLPDSIRRVASVTKAFTAVAVLKLVEDGKLYLDQPVSSIVPEFDTSAHRTITVFHLLTHTAGICADGGYFAEPYPRGWWTHLEEDNNWIKAVLSGPPLSKPGERYSYSSAGYGILGEMIGRVSGMHYNDYIRQSILEPLGMDRTFFEVPEHLHDEVCLVDSFDRDRLTSKTRPDQMPRAGGGLHSTLRDLWKFGQMLLDKGTFGGSRVISRKSVEAMTRNHLFNVPAFAWGVQIPSKNYGLGLNLFLEKGELKTPQSFSHEGAGRCALHIDPVEQLVAVYFVPTAFAGFLPETIVHPSNIIWSGLL